jgi:hypothetical protein
MELPRWIERRTYVELVIRQRACSSCFVDNAGERRVETFVLSFPYVNWRPTILAVSPLLTQMTVLSLQNSGSTHQLGETLSLHSEQ